MTEVDLATTVWPATYGGDAKPRMGFFTDTSICIGCKACEVACKEWNGVPEDGRHHLGRSMDNTGGLGADTWRHVAFIEQRRSLDISEGLQGDLVGHAQLRELADRVGMPGADLGGFRWLMASDVCKHCTNAACLDVCPTGALFRTEFGTVVVQPDVCNGCGYCVTACPFGVLDQRQDDGRVWKCTLCYDRLKADQTPACAQACPTASIQYGPLEELRETAKLRLETVIQAGETDASIYLGDPDDGVGGGGAFFLLLDDPEVYGLPPDPIDTTRELAALWLTTALAAGALLTGVVAAVVGGRR